MKILKWLPGIALLSMLVLSACFPSAKTPTTEPTLAASATIQPSPTLRPERNVALNKPVRVSASWVVDPPERAVDGNLYNWWGAGGPVPQWIEVDLEGLYTVSRIRVINQGPTGNAIYKVYGRGLDNKNQLLHVFDGLKFENQTLEFSPDTALAGISTIRIEINSGSGWVGFREIEVYSRENPQPLPAVSENETPSFLAEVQAASLEPITADNAIIMEQLSMLGRGKINQLAWSPDGKTVAAAGTLGIWLYDPVALEFPPLLLEGHSREVLGVAFSQDGTTLFSGSQDGTVKQWDTTTGGLKRTLSLWDDFSYEVGDQKRDPEVWSMAFSPDNEWLAAGRYDGTLVLWDLSTRNMRKELKGHNAPITSVAFSPDGMRLASYSINGSLLIWDVPSGIQKTKLTSQGQVQSLAFSPDSKILAYGGMDMSLHLWDVVAGKELAELEDHQGVLDLAFSPDGLSLVSSTIDSVLQSWDSVSGKTRILSDQVGLITSMAFNPGGTVLVASSLDGTIQKWDEPFAGYQIVTTAHTSPVTSIAFSPDDKILATGGEDGNIRLWGVEENRLRSVLRGHSSTVSGVSFSPDGQRLVSSSFDGTVRIWDLNSGKQVKVLSGHGGYVRSVSFNPDGKMIASGGTDRFIILWDAVTGKELAVFSGHTGEVESVAFSPDSAWLVSTSADKTVRIWNIVAGEEASVLKGHQSYTLSAAFSPDGTMLASGGGDHSLRLWNWEMGSGTPTGTARLGGIGHPGWVTGVAFSPDGKIFAGANVSTTSFWVAPGEVHLYSTDTGYPYALLRGHTKRITSIVFSSDGKLLASGSADGSVRLWGIPGEGGGPVDQPTIPPTQTQQPAVTIQLTLPAQPAESTFILDAGSIWADSGIEIAADDAVIITASGEVSTANLDEYPKAVSGPDGQDSSCSVYEAYTPCIIFGSPYGALVGKVGLDGTPFLIGSGITLTSSVSGELYLIVNDNLPYYYDNAGTFVVTFSRE